MMWDVAGWYYLTMQQGVISVGDAVEVLKKRVGPPQEWGS